MKKRKQPQPIKKQQEDKPLTLGDMLNQELMNKLKDTKSQLQQAEVQKKEAEEARKREERRLKEKNKSFEELLNESDVDWKKFK